jgi:hypothetical protein
MKKRPFLLLLIAQIFVVNSFAQDNVNACKVLADSLKTSYIGDCKKGLAHGKGVAIGADWYRGEFRYGYPNGQGEYHYSDSSVFVGEFLEGLREGKGVCRMPRIGMPDSVLTGYWSGDIYRGKQYRNYSTDISSLYDRVEILASNNTGNRIVFEVSTTSGIPNQSLRITENGYLLSLVELVAVDGGNKVRLLSNYASGLKNVWTYEIAEFPLHLRGRFSDGRTFNLELFKSANWTVRIFVNK